MRTPPLLEAASLLVTVHQGAASRGHAGALVACAVSAASASEWGARRAAADLLRALAATHPEAAGGAAPRVYAALHLLRADKQKVVREAALGALATMRESVGDGSGHGGGGTAGGGASPSPAGRPGTGSHAGAAAAAAAASAAASASAAAAAGCAAGAAAAAGGGRREGPVGAQADRRAVPSAAAHAAAAAEGDPAAARPARPVGASPHGVVRILAEGAPAAAAATPVGCGRGRGRAN